MKHLDSGIIQAFLDGELSDAQLNGVTAHLSVCDVCTGSLMEAENETAAIDFAFAAEKSLLCPTQRIWARLENEIDGLNRQPQPVRVETSLWHKATAFLPFGESFNFTSSQVAFAGSFAAVLLFSVLAVSVLRQEQTAPQVAGNAPPQVENQMPGSIQQQVVQIEQPQHKTIENSTLVITKQPKNTNFQIVKADYIESNNLKPNAGITGNRKPTIANRKSNAPLPEEKTYLAAIADLSKTVKTGDALVMRPSFRVQYEQNLAAMDNAISKMQEQVRRNPKDENARRILFNSYQNKIDLLNGVAEKTQMMASMR